MSEPIVEVLWSKMLIGTGKNYIRRRVQKLIANRSENNSNPDHNCVALCYIVFSVFLG
jgi:hypothetical protein